MTDAHKDALKSVHAHIRAFEHEKSKEHDTLVRAHITINPGGGEVYECIVFVGDMLINARSGCGAASNLERALVKALADKRRKFLEANK